MARVVSVTPIPLERDSRTLKHAASLARLGYESVVVEGRPSASLPDGLPFEVITTAALRERTARRTGRPAQSYRFLRDYRETNRRTLESLPDAELYWLHSYWQFPAVRRKCRATSAAFVYDAHDSYRDMPPIDLPLAPPALAAIERRCVRGASACSTVSEGVARRLRERFGREFTVIRNCHELRLDTRSPTGIREVLGLADRDFLVIMVGQRKFGLAVEEAIAACRALDRGINFAFVGAGFEHEGESVQAGSSRIHFVAPVEPTRLVDFVRAADAASLLYKPVTANMVHALPNGFFHAVAAGLPLLYPPLDEVRRLAERHALGRPVDPAEPSSIAEGIRALRDDPERLKQLRENAGRARDELNWAHEEPIVATLAQRALETGRGRIA